MAQPYQAYPYRGPKEPSALERLQSWWNSFGGQPLPPADTSTRTDWQNIPELTQPEAPLKGLLHPAAQLALDVAPVTGEYRAAQRVQPLLGEGGRMIREGDLLGGSGKMAEGTAEYLSTLPLVGLGVRPLVGLAKAGAEAAPPFFSRLAKHLSGTQRGKATGREWMKDLAKEEERLRDFLIRDLQRADDQGIFTSIRAQASDFKSIEDAEAFLRDNPNRVKNLRGDVLKREDLIATDLVPNPKAGVKIEELEATGVKGLLEANLEKVFTRKELQDWADANAIQVEEVMYGQTVPEFKLVEDRSGIKNELMELWAKAEPNVERPIRQLDVPVHGPIRGPSGFFREIFEQELSNWGGGLGRGFRGVSDQTGLSIEEAKRAEEIIQQLHAPQGASISPNTFATREEAEKALARETKSHYGYTVRDYSGRTVSYHYTRESAQQDAKLIDGGLVINEGAPKKADYKIIESERKVPTHLEGTNLQLEGSREYRELVLKFPDTDPPIFPHLGPHHPVDNPILHLRFNERTGPEGERMLFIEELQSDWGQRGQHLGWKDPGADKGNIDELKDRLASLNRESSDLQSARLAEDYESGQEGNPLLDRIREISTETAHLTGRIAELQSMGGPPKAPIVSKTDTWTDLGLRRMLRYAVDNGYSSIGVSTGATQLRYWPGAKEGLADYYDRIIPNRLNKIAKSLGGKVKVQTKDTDILQSQEWAPSIELQDAGQEFFQENPTNLGARGEPGWAFDVRDRDTDEHFEVLVTDYKIEAPDFMIRGNTEIYAPDGESIYEHIDRMLLGGSEQDIDSSMRDIERYLRHKKGPTEADKVKIRTLEITDKMKESILKGMPLLAGAGITAGLLSEQQRQQAPQSLIY